ncbi:Uncharacterised protein [Vibrio cholerae]|nr:Uncharacterised protein [Vibrio cholerae]
MVHKAQRIRYRFIQLRDTTGHSASVPVLKNTASTEP